MEIDDLARTGFDAFNRGDVEAVRRILHPDVEVHSVAEVGEAGTYHGHDGFLAWMGVWMDAWETFQIEIERIEEVDDRNVLVHVNQQGRGKGSGLEVDQRVIYLFTMADGQVSRLHIYRDREAALKAVPGY